VKYPQQPAVAAPAPAGAPARAPSPLPSVETLLSLQRTAGNAATIRALARVPRVDPHVNELAKKAIDELDGERRRKVLIATVLSAAKLGELPAFARVLRAAQHDVYAHHLAFLFAELEDDWGSQNTVSLMVMFADAGVEIAKDVAYDETPLATVATFKSFAKQIRALIQSGDLSKKDLEPLMAAIGQAERELRAVESPPKGPPQVAVAGGAAAASAAAWRIAAALAADDVAGVGVADDVAIPFVIVAAVALSAAALVWTTPKPPILDYAPARTKVEAALRQMTDLVRISKAIAIQGPRASGQLGNVAVHLARLLAVGAVGGRPSGEPPKQNNDNDNHWWSEIKASLKQFFQATKDASRKQILRELLKDYTEAQIAEIEAALSRAETLMGETVGRILPPP
jgi:hypothetical protein